MTPVSPTQPSLARQQQAMLEALEGQRSVRAVAYAGSFSAGPQPEKTARPGEQAWAGSRPQVLAWQRGLKHAVTRQEGSVQLTLFPLDTLELWRAEPLVKAGTPLGLLATCRPQYDPARQLSRLQQQVLKLGEQQRREWQQLLLAQAGDQLNEVGARFRRSASPHLQLCALGTARQIATQQLLPALLAQQGIWANETRLHSSARLPHWWRTWLELPCPRASGILEQLYGFGGRTEAEHVLRAARGLGLEQVAQQARTAAQYGYFDGAVRLLRDATFATYQAKLGDWTHYSARKQSKVGALLGIERAPVGAGALALTKELLDLARTQ